VAIIAAAYRVATTTPAPSVANHEAHGGGDDPERHRGDADGREREQWLQGFDAERVLQFRVTGVGE
jgi:hypothetical protein